MLFNSAQFLLAFFPLVTVLFFALPHRFRWMLLLAASAYFYMAFVPVYILILAFTIVVDYFAGILIEGAQGNRRRWYLGMSIVANLAVLAVFKYYNFLNETLRDATGLWGTPIAGPVLEILLPIGLSFHTFQAMSYTIEVYRGAQTAERHFGIYSLYVLFYPQLVAGPIERPQNLLPQFHAEHKFDADRARDGLRQMLLGYIKKIVIADRLAMVVDPVYTSPQSYPASVLAFATVCFAFQIYTDFSGYSDIAIGAARVMGFDLMTNFRHPYVAQSISEFWRRWHISLSTWFRDYVYLPLGGSRVGKVRWQVNLLITFLASGLWHGANWTFVIWGGLNGIFLVAANVFEPASKKVRRWVRAERWPRAYAALQIAVTFALICFTWVFFRAPTLGHAFHVLGGIARDAVVFVQPRRFYVELRDLTPVSHGSLILAILGFVGLFCFDLASERGMTTGRLAAMPRPARWALYYASLALLLFAGKFGEQQFIYFQF